MRSERSFRFKRIVVSYDIVLMHFALSDGYAEVVSMARSGNELGKGRQDLHMLPRISDRMSFLYVQRCVVNRSDGALTISDARGVKHVPAACLSGVFFGPGVSVTSAAMGLLGDVGAAAVWVAEGIMGVYASGRSLSGSSAMAETQARLVSSRMSRLGIARRMYAMRFPDDDVSGMNMRQLRGKEGARMRAVYKTAAERTGVKWSGRSYKVDDFEDADGVNKALSTANHCLYGLCHAVICALGLVPQLGFVHAGHALSFVYDVADLYKAETTVPLAFEVAADDAGDVVKETRQRCRRLFFEERLVERVVSDMLDMFGTDGGSREPVLLLWDDFGPAVEAGKSHGADTAFDNSELLVASAVGM